MLQYFVGSHILAGFTVLSYKFMIWSSVVNVLGSSQPLSFRLIRSIPGSANVLPSGPFTARQNCIFVFPASTDLNGAGSLDLLGSLPSIILFKKSICDFTCSAVMFGVLPTACPVLYKICTTTGMVMMELLLLSGLFLNSLILD